MGRFTTAHRPLIERSSTGTSRSRSMWRSHGIENTIAASTTTAAAP